MRLPEWGPISKFATADAHTITDRKGVKKPILRDIDINKTPAKSRYLGSIPG
jgi:hypothetical protein